MTWLSQTTPSIETTPCIANALDVFDQFTENFYQWRRLNWIVGIADANLARLWGYPASDTVFCWLFDCKTFVCDAIRGDPSEYAVKMEHIGGRRDLVQDGGGSATGKGSLVGSKALDAQNACCTCDNLRSYTTDRSGLTNKIYGLRLAACTQAGDVPYCVDGSPSLAGVTVLEISIWVCSSQAVVPTRICVCAAVIA